MSKITSIVKTSALFLYLIAELSLTYLQIRIKFSLMKRKWIKDFKKELKKQGIKGRNLEALVKIYKEYLEAFWGDFMNPLNLARNLRKISD